MFNLDSSYHKIYINVNVCNSQRRIGIVILHSFNSCSRQWLIYTTAVPFIFASISIPYLFEGPPKFLSYFIFFLSFSIHQSIFFFLFSITQLASITGKGGSSSHRKVNLAHFYWTIHLTPTNYPIL